MARELHADPERRAFPTGGRRQADEGPRIPSVLVALALAVLTEPGDAAVARGLALAVIAASEARS